MSPMVGLRPDGWTKTIALNLDSVFHASQIAAQPCSSAAAARSSRCRRWPGSTEPRASPTIPPPREAFAVHPGRGAGARAGGGAPQHNRPGLGRDLAQRDAARRRRLPRVFAESMVPMRRFAEPKRSSAPPSSSPRTRVLRNGSTITVEGARRPSARVKGKRQGGGEVGGGQGQSQRQGGGDEGGASCRAGLTFIRTCVTYSVPDVRMNAPTGH